MITTKPFSGYESEKQKVLAAMRTDYAKGQTAYAPLFYGLIASDPKAFGLTWDDLRILQRRAFLTTALFHWSYLDLDLRSARNSNHIVEAADYAHEWLHNSIQPPYQLDDAALRSISVDPELFHRLAKLLDLAALSALQTDLSRHENSERIRQKYGEIKTRNQLTDETPIDYKSEVKKLGYKPISDDDLYWHPIMNLINDIIREGWRYGAIRQGSLRGNLYITSNDFYKKIEAAVEPRLKWLTRAREEIFRRVGISHAIAGVNNFLKPSSNYESRLASFVQRTQWPDISDFRDTHGISEDVYRAIFESSVSSGAPMARELHDMVKIYQLDPGRLGFREGDFQKIDDLFIFEHNLTMLQDKLCDGGIDLLDMKDSWIGYPRVFSPNVLDELGIPRSQGELLVMAVVFEAVRQLASELNGEDEKWNYDLERASALMNPILGRDGSYRWSIKELQEFDYEAQYMTYEINPENPIASAYRPFVTLPDPDKPISAWFPEMAQRVRERNGLSPHRTAVSSPTIKPDSCNAGGGTA